MHKELPIDSYHEVIERINDGDSVSDAVKGIMTRKTFYFGLKKYPELGDIYARACEARAEAIFDEILEIADESSNDIEQIDLGDGMVSEKVNHEAIQRSKLRVDARKWALSKMNPKRFGEKLDVTSNDQTLPAPVIIAPNSPSE